MKCLLPEKINEFKRALKDKEINLSDLLNLDHDELVKKLEPYAGTNAVDVATLLEEKLVLKNRVLGLKNALNKMTQNGKYSETAEGQKFMNDYLEHQVKQDRIFSPSENESYLQGIVDKKLGFSVSREVAAKIGELSHKANEAADAPTTNLSGVSTESVQASKALHDYVESQRPVSAAGSIFKNLAITGRNFKLTNPSTPLKTTIGQSISAVTEKLMLRVGTLTAKGASRDLAAQAYKEEQATFAKTGIDTTSGNGVLGEGRAYDLPSGLKSENSVVRGIQTAASAAAKYSTKVAIDWEHSITMTKFHQRAFFDALNILSTKFAKGDTAAARSLFTDAAKRTPETPEGTALRLAAQKHAARVIATNDTWASGLTLSVRDYLNKKVDGLGTLAAPIVKIPATLIANGIENSGVGIATGLTDAYKGWTKIQSPDLATKYEGLAQYSNGLKTFSRTVGIMSAAAYFTSQLNASDFKTDRYGGQFVRMGNTWVNMEYFNVVGPAISGMMELKKNQHKPLGTKVVNYVSGAAQGLRNLPVFTEANKIITDLTEGQGKQIMPYVKNFVTGFVDPAVVSHSLSAHPIKELFFSTTGLPSQQELKKLGAK